MQREEEIQLTAYYIWEEEGCGHGRHIDHWLKAEVIWEEKQKKKPASANIKAEAKPTPKQTKK
jgi:hypothetical protein